jgi:hypothetical protein
MWSTGYMIQTRYADFGSTCDLNNPDRKDNNGASNPAPNYANGLFSNPSPFNYQSGPFNTCGGNSHFSQNNFSPLPLTTRAAWMYRACRRIGAEATSAQIAMMVERVKVPDPTPTPIPASGVGQAIDVRPVNLDGTGTNPAMTYNWCTKISAPVESDYQSIFRAFYPGRNIPQIIDPSRSQNQQLQPGASSAKSIHPSTALLGLGAPPARADLLAPVLGANTTPQFREHLMALVTESNQYIDTLPSTGPLRWQALESPCMPGLGAPTPTKDQVKALAAWRALFITMCMDPGWQVL